MKIQILSDLHQEFHRDKRVLEEKDIVGEVVLLAGDITAGSRSIEYLKEYDVDIYSVLGNHEFYGRHWKHAVEEYKMIFANSNVHVMEDECITVKDKFILIASTLWTNFVAPMSQSVTPTFEVEPGWEHQAFFCQQMMSDFGAITALNVSAWEERHNRSREFIRLALSSNRDKGLPMVVMTHHAPSFQSTHPQYKDSPINGGFSVNLDWMIEEYQPALWIHGHHHTSSDYNIGQTRIICNPRGYPNEKFNTFNPYLTVEL